VTAQNTGYSHLLVMAPRLARLGRAKWPKAVKCVSWAREGGDGGEDLVVGAVPVAK
jgi:hypothetical protein